MTIVILGVGNRFRGDDAIGSLVASELTIMFQASSFRLQNNNILVYDTETTPENFIDKVVKNKPDWLIIIDACNFGGEAGEYKLFEGDEINEISYGLLSTHTLPLTLTIELIKKQHNCKISLIGIQPESFILTTDMSPELLKAKDLIIKFIKGLLLKPAFD